MVLFSTGCPQCYVLEVKLQQKNIDFEISDNVQELIDMGIKRLPVLKLDSGEYLDFSKALNFVNEWSDNN